MSGTKNLALSVHRRIMNRAEAERKPFAELLQYYSMERFLYRLGCSAHRRNFILKGAYVFVAWKAPRSRPTRDLDLLGFSDNSVENIVRIVREICNLPVDPDGIVFDSGTVTSEVIQERDEYQGVRISFHGFLGKSRIPMRLDIGFGDIITPAPIEIEMTTILSDMNKPNVLVYPPEAVVAEKFHILVDLGLMNSRIKDYFDLWWLSRNFEFRSDLLLAAIRNTFTHRKTSVPVGIPPGLTPEFSRSNQSMWERFIDKNGLSDAPKDLNEVILDLIVFFVPIIDPQENITLQWTPGSGWTRR